MLQLKEGMVFKELDSSPNIITHEDSGYTIVDCVIPENNVTEYDEEIKETANGIWLFGGCYTKTRLWINLGLVNDYSNEYYQSFQIKSESIDSICKKTLYRSFLETLRPIITEKATIALNSMKNIRYEKVLFANKYRKSYEVIDREEIYDIAEKVTQKIIKDQDTSNYSNLLKRALNYKLDINYIYWQYKIERLNDTDSHKTLLSIMKKIAEKYVDSGQEKYPNYFFNSSNILKYDILKHKLEFVEQRLKEEGIDDKDYR